MKLLKVIGLVVFLMNTNCNYACVCGDWDFAGLREIQESDLDENKLIVTGEITKISIRKVKNKKRPKTSTSLKVVELKVLQSFYKGFKKRTLKLITGNSIATCGFPFEEEQVYLIILSKQKNNLAKIGIKYSTSICLPNRIYNDLSEKERKLIEERK